MLKYTARLSHYCSYMFRSTSTIIMEPRPKLATILWKQSVKIRRYIFSNVVVKSVSSCGVYPVPHGTDCFHKIVASFCIGPMMMVQVDRNI